MQLSLVGGKNEITKAAEVDSQCDPVPVETAKQVG